MNSFMMKLSVRISDFDWARLKGERTKIRAVLKSTHVGICRRKEERRANAADLALMAISSRLGSVGG
jgi:hypothetical protein